MPPDSDAPKGSEPRRGKASAEAVLRAWQDGLSLVPLEGGGWAPLPSDWLEKFGDRVADLLAARDAEGRVSRVSIPALSALCDDLDQPRPPSFDKLAPLIHGFESLPEVELPKDLTATLRAYQKVGVDWLCFLRDAGLGAVLADDMGLGKTLQTLCAVEGRTLIVCPKSVLHNWEAEARRFRPGLKIADLSRAAPRARQAGRLDDHDLRHLAPRRRAPRGRDVGYGRARRSAGDQEPGQPGVARRVRAESQLPGRAQRYAPGKSPGRAVEHVPLLAPRFALGSLAVSRSLQLADRARQQEEAGRAAREDQTLHLAPPEARSGARAAAAHGHGARDRARSERARFVQRRARGDAA